MPLDLVWFQLPNMDIYFNKILAWAAILYIFYFLMQRAILDCNIKDNIPNEKIWFANRLLGILRLMPIVLIIFAMYNVDNQSLIDGLKYNECKEFTNKMESYSQRNVNGIDYNYTNITWEIIDKNSKIVISNTSTGVVR